MNLRVYFGEGGCFAEACEDYRQHHLPMEVVSHASFLGDSYIAYCLGFAFGKVLQRRSMTISDEALEEIAIRKITSGNPAEFINGFDLSYQPLVTSH